MITSINEKIERLKKERNALILAHYYEDGDIQDIADHVGDSFYLAKMGQKASQDVILLAGVVFMAESVKILNPTKKVLVPDLGAGCSLVEGSPFDKYLSWRKQHPDAIAVTYVNSSAEVKAISDVIITSSNAAQIIDAIPRERKILFGPDQHLGRFLSKQTGREFILWPGSCQVHVLFNAKKLYDLMLDHPEAQVLAHPECDESVLKLAHIIGSTSKLIETVQTGSFKKYIVATETGIFHQMKKARPDVTLIQAPVLDQNCLCNNCPYMKMNSLEKIAKALEDLQPEIRIKESLRGLAQISLDRMMSITAGHKVNWPNVFSSQIELQ